MAHRRFWRASGSVARTAQQHDLRTTLRSLNLLLRLYATPDNAAMETDPLPNQPAEAADLHSHPCNVMSDAMPQRTSSRTALGVAVVRAVHQLLDCEPKILDDPIAARLLGADVVQQLQSHPARALEPWARALRSHVVLRSRYAEECMAQAVRRDVRQCVILGAGFDTFAYRQPDWAAPLAYLRSRSSSHAGGQARDYRRLVFPFLRIWNSSPLILNWLRCVKGCKRPLSTSRSPRSFPVLVCWFT